MSKSQYEALKNLIWTLAMMLAATMSSGDGWWPWIFIAGAVLFYISYWRADRDC